MKIIKFDTIPSTNLYLKENYQVLDNLTVVCAKHQTKGRGRLGRTWIDNNDLLFSILIKENLDRPSDYSFLIASTILKILKELNPLVKWPNDIIINNKKVAGILLEAVTVENIKCIVIGVGLNTNSKEFSDELVFKANSLSNILNKNIDNDFLLEKIMLQFENDYYEYVNGNNNYKNIIVDNFYLQGKEITFNYDNKVHFGKVIGMNKENELLVEIDKEIKAIKSGEVTLTNNYK